MGGSALRAGFKKILVHCLHIVTLRYLKVVRILEHVGLVHPLVDGVKVAGDLVVARLPQADDLLLLGVVPDLQLQRLPHLVVPARRQSRPEDRILGHQLDKRLDTKKSPKLVHSSLYEFCKTEPDFHVIPFNVIYF